jgi:4-amino-4-deoxy-L-arabinose transferase-like glycosyltransferase
MRVAVCSEILIPVLARRLLPEVAVVGLAALLCLAGLGGDAMRDWDEAIYAGVAREGVESGSWGSLRLDGELFADKPPLVVWCIEASYRLLGVSELSSRLPIALFGIAGVALVYLIARRLAGRREALLAALILATAPQWIRFSRQAMLDVPLTTCLAAGFLALLAGCWPLLGVALGAAVMVKGPAALVVLPAIAAWAATEPRKLRQAGYGLGLAAHAEDALDERDLGLDLGAEPRDHARHAARHVGRNLERFR